MASNTKKMNYISRDGDKEQIEVQKSNLKGYDSKEIKKNNDIKRKKELKSLETASKNAGKEYSINEQKYREKVKNERNKINSFDYTSKNNEIRNKNIKDEEIKVQNNSKEELANKEASRNKFALADYNYNVKKYSKENYKPNAFDKITQPIVSGVSEELEAALTGSGGVTRKYVDENGKTTYLPVARELQDEAINNSYSDTIFGKTANVLGGILRESSKNLTAKALDSIFPGWGTTAYYGNVFQNKYRDSVNKGYDDQTSALNAAAITGQSFVKQKALGGLGGALTKFSNGNVNPSGLEKTLTNVIKKFVPNQTITRTLASAGAEGIDEWSDEYIEALIDKATLEKEKNIGEYVKLLGDKDLRNRAIYSGIVGAGTGATGAGFSKNKIADDLNIEKQRQNEIKRNKTQNNNQQIQEIQQNNNQQKIQQQEVSKEQRINDLKQEIQAEQQRVERGTTDDGFTLASKQKELENLQRENNSVNNSQNSNLTENELKEYQDLKTADSFTVLNEKEQKRYNELTAKQNNTKVYQELNNRTEEDISNRKVNAIQYDNPEIKPFFKDAAQDVLQDLNDSQKGERYMREDGTWGGNKRNVPADVGELLDKGYSYNDIKKGLNAIIEDSGKENIKVAKEIELLLDNRLQNGSQTFGLREGTKPNQDYIDVVSGIKENNNINNSQNNNVNENVANQRIQGLENYSRDEVKNISKDYIVNKLKENGIDGVTIKDIEINGSRNRGDAKYNSDLDIVLEYDGDIREDDLFNILNDENLEIDGIKVDINPITASKTGTMENYMQQSNQYVQETQEIYNEQNYKGLSLEEMKSDTNVIAQIAAYPEKEKYLKWTRTSEFFELDVKEMDRITKILSKKANEKYRIGETTGCYLDKSGFMFYYYVTNNNGYGITKMKPIRNEVKEAVYETKINRTSENTMANTDNGRTFSNGNIEPIRNGKTNTRNEELVKNREFKNNKNIKNNQQSINNEIESNNKVDSFFNEKNNNIPAKVDSDLKLTIDEDGNAKLSNEEPKILNEMPENEIRPIRSAISETFERAYRGVVDKGQAIYKLSRKTNNPFLYHLYDRLGISTAESQVQIGTNQTDLNGKAYTNFIDKNGKETSMSVQDIWTDANKSGINDKTLNEYLVNKLNIDRINNGVEQFENLTLEHSENVVNELESKYGKKLDRVANNVWTYYQNQLQKMVDSGLVSQKVAEQFMKETPHYVRIQRNTGNNSTSNGLKFRNKKIEINNQIQKIKGGNFDILPLKETMAKYTQEVTSSIRKNLLGKELAKTLGVGSVSEDISSVDESFGINPDLLTNDGKGNYTLTIFDDGVATVVPIDEGIYESLSTNKDAFEKTIDSLGTITGARLLSKVQRTLLTDKNPVFMATNMLKDIGDAPLNSKYGATLFYKNYVRTIGDKATFSKYSRLYENLGGGQNSYFYDGKFKKQGSNLNPITWIEKGNNFIESLPRITEFMTTIEQNGYEINKNGEVVPAKGKKITKTVEQVLNEAMYNSAEITTNFKRGGAVAKTLNRNGATFLNASIQGFDKQIRNFTEIQNPKQAVNLLTKIAILGVAPALFNNAVYDDDDEYEDLPDYVKDEYYLIKGEDNKWIRIPKGRVMSVFGGAARRAYNYSQGDEKAFKGFVKEAGGQVAPNNPFEENIFAPLSAVKRNESWSGNKIVNDYLSTLPEEEQYDARTSEIAKSIGAFTKYSPKKIDYLLDQYTGGIGDVVLPATTKHAESESDDLVSSAIVNPFKSKFTTDSVLNNATISKYYDMEKKLQKKSNSSKSTGLDKAKYNYIGKYSDFKDELNDLYADQREIQDSDYLTNNEKYIQNKEIQKQINNKLKETMDALNNAKEVDDGVYKIGSEYKYEKTDENGKTKIGSLSTDAVTSANKANVNLGTYAKIVVKYNSLEADKDSNGKSISGSKKAKIKTYLDSLGLDKSQKNIILESLNLKGDYK